MLFSPKDSNNALIYRKVFKEKTLFFSLGRMNYIQSYKIDKNSLRTEATTNKFFCPLSDTPI